MSLFCNTEQEQTCLDPKAWCEPSGKINWFYLGKNNSGILGGEGVGVVKGEKESSCCSAVELPYRESRLAAASAYLPSCFSDYCWSRPLSTQLKPVVRLLFCMEALLSGLTAWLPREQGSRDRRIGGKKAFPGQLKHGERSRETKRW